MAAPEQEQVHPYDAPGPWTEEDWLALPENPRVELVEGSYQRRTSGRTIALTEPFPVVLDLGALYSTR